MPKDERQLARMPLKTLMEQRDIFVFQCMIGCRVGDLLKMNDKYIHNGILVYTPHKTKDEGDEAVQARVPLHPRAVSLIEKYKGADPEGRLFPFITAQRYNDAIKVIFKMAGITRNVEVRNPRTGENEIVPINEVASSHLARRTFVGNAYFKVHDPNLIGKMSGHVEGSKAFKRYRKIEDDTLKEVIDLIG
jgi:integrase